MVDSRPGTTRDAIDTPLCRDGRNYVFIDTAGLRRRSRISERLEKYSVIRALKSLERCDVALVLIDGYEGLTEQDTRVIEFAAESGRALLLIVNKWDLVHKDSRTIDGYKNRISREIKTFDYIPVLFVSALTGQRVGRIFAAIQEVVEESRKRIPTGNLNQWLHDALQALPPPPSRNRPVKIYFLSQVKASPPTFVFFTNRPQDITEPYRRFLLRRLREKYGFSGVPIRFLFRQRKKESP
jgi:GTP-binding protein